MIEQDTSWEIFSALFFSRLTVTYIEAMHIFSWKFFLDDYHLTLPYIDALDTFIVTHTWNTNHRNSQPCIKFLVSVASTICISLMDSQRQVPVKQGSRTNEIECWFLSYLESDVSLESCEQDNLNLKKNIRVWRREILNVERSAIYQCCSPNQLEKHMWGNALPNNKVLYIRLVFDICDKGICILEYPSVSIVAAYMIFRNPRRTSFTLIKIHIIHHRWTVRYSEPMTTVSVRKQGTW